MNAAAPLNSVGHRPDGKWAFDASVTDCFPDMLGRSIPGYETMRKLVLDLGSKFVQRGTHILDVGSSRGDGIMPFIDRFGAGNRYVCLDESPEMNAACRKLLDGYIATGLADVREHDLRNGLPMLMPSLILSVLTLQFVPIEFRQKIVADAYRMLRPGGAMVVVEKCLGQDAETEKLFVDAYLQTKADHGYSADDIAAKRKALQGVLVPMPTFGNEMLLASEGFKVVRFWQHLQFVGWLAIKPKGGQ